jgi:hypothetical protein
MVLQKGAERAWIGTSRCARRCCIDSLHKPLLNSIDDSSRSAPDPRFVVDMCYMVLDRFLAHVQSLRTLESIVETIPNRCWHIDMLFSK